MPQITGRMTPDERLRFAEYSREVGVDGGTVASLLINRELRLRRLPALWSELRNRPDGTTSGTITSHRLGVAQKAHFYSYVERQSLSASKALGLLCRVELKERWLERSLTSPTRIESSFDSDRVGG